MKVLVFGSLNIDTIYKLEHIVQPNEDVYKRQIYGTEKY